MTTPVKPLFVPLPFQDAPDQGRLILRDGTTALVRPAGPADQPLLAAFWARLSPESRLRRFLSFAKPSPNLTAALCDDSQPALCRTLLVLRTLEGEGRIVAVGSYQKESESAAEVAFAVDDAFQGKGLGTLLLERLALMAARHGFSKFSAVTLASNQPMLAVFRDSGFTLREGRDSDCVDVVLDLEPNEASVARSELRDRFATTASLKPLLEPKSVAVVGASRDPASIGGRLLEALVSARFNGPVYPVNPKASVVGCIRAYPSVRDLPEPVDLAIIAVPKGAVLSVVDDCAARGVKGLVVITAGFAEVDAAGKAAQAELLAKVRGYGMRMVGPNCMGLLNATPAFNLNASFSNVFPPAGNVAMSSQSGALGLAILAQARRANLGLSTFVSVGNKADVSGNDLLQYWEEDPSTDVILLYLESFGNPRRFARIARRVGRRKPIIAIKSGRSQAGRRAASSHTAALAAGDTAVDALFKQTGVLRAETLEEMFHLAAVLGSQPLPRGKRVGIVTNAGGPAILCTDMCEAEGLSVPELSEDVKARLRTFLPPAAGLSNPVDMIASATPEMYTRTLETLLTCGEVDSVIAIHIPVGLTDLELIEAAIAEGVLAGRKAECGMRSAECGVEQPDSSGRARLLPSLVPGSTDPANTEPSTSRDRQGAALGSTDPTKGTPHSSDSSFILHPSSFPPPVLAVLMTDQPVGTRLRAGDEKIPSYQLPESAARALAKAAAYAEWRASPPGFVPDFEDIDPSAARKICLDALAADGPGWMAEHRIRELLETFKLPVVPGGLAHSADEAVALAERVGYPVAVKLASTKFTHKTEVGGVRLNLRDAASVRSAFEDMRLRIAELESGAGSTDATKETPHSAHRAPHFATLVQPMIPAGIETLVGVTQDPQFGPLTAFGLGGVNVEVVGDVVFRVAPLTDRDAADMVDSIRGRKLIEGFRGKPPGDRAAVEELLLRVSRLAEEVPEIREMDMNPVIVRPPGQGCVIVDARIRLGR